MKQIQQLGSLNSKLMLTWHNVPANAMDMKIFHSPNYESEE